MAFEPACASASTNARPATGRTPNGDRLGLENTGISVSDTPDQIKAFAAEFGINYPLFVAADRQDVMEAYRAIMAYPVSWFIKPDGSVFLKHLGSASPEWFEQQVMALLEASAVGAS